MGYESKLSSWWLRVACAAALLLLGACATIPSAGIDYGENLPADGGLVAVQVVTNSQKLSSALPNWTEVLVVDQDRVGMDGKHLIYSLPALNDGLSSTRAFVGVLRPGRYRFAGLHAFAKVVDFSYYVTARAPVTVGSFEVQTDRLTNLGTVLFQPFLGDPQAVGPAAKVSHAMSRLDDSVALEDFVARRYPAQYGRTRGQAAIGWLPDALGPLREQLAAAIRRRAVLSEPHFDAASGEIYYTARLGTLYRRDASGRWHSAHLPTRYDLIAFVKLPDGRLVAGGERGGLWYADDFDGEWTSEPLDDREQTVVWLGVLGDGLYAVTSTGDRYRLHQAHAAPATARQWRVVGEYGKHDQDERARVFAIERTPPIIADADGLRLFGERSSHRFDAKSGALAPAPGFGTNRLVNQPNGISVAMPYTAWTGTKPPQVSRDRGAHWEPYHRLGQFHEAPYVFEDGSVLGVGSRSLYGFNWGKREKVDILVSHDKGATSALVGQLGYGCGDVEAAISTDARLFARCYDGTLLTSTDRGRTWVRESDRSARPEEIPQEFITTEPDDPAGAH